MEVLAHEPLPIGTEIAFATWHAGPPRPPLTSTRLKQFPWHIVLVLVPLVVIYMWLFWSTRGHRYILLHVLLQIGATIPGGIFAYATFWCKHWQTPQSVLGRMDVPAVVLQFPVHIIISEDTKILGDDDGLVSFHDDILHFEGLRTSFDLPRGPTWFVEKLGFVMMGHPILKNPLRGPFELKCPAWLHRGTILMTPYRKVGQSNQNNPKAFRDALQGWNKAASRLHTKISLPPTGSSSPPQKPTIWNKRLF